MTSYKSEFLNILEQRGFIHQCSDFESLDKKLSEGTQSAYIGFDATAKSLHVGNLTGIMMLYWFQQCGHKPITLMGGDLNGVVKAFRLSRNVMRNIRQNLFFALIYNGLGVPVAAGVLVPIFGMHALLNPMFAAAAMSFSSVSVIGNALRLRATHLTE